MLSHSGELLQIHGRSRDEATEDGPATIGHTVSGKPVYGPGVLCGSQICQVDVDGSVLVTDRGNDRLQVMRADGTWSVLDLNQPVSRPTGAAWCNGSLYVVDDDKIARFS